MNVMFRNFARRLLVVATFLFLFNAHFVFAQPASGNPGGNPPTPAAVPLDNPLGGNCNDLTCPLNAVIDFLFTIAIPLCAIMVLWGGFQMVTAAGDPEKFSKGRKTILYAAVGFAVILIAKGVSALVRGILGV